MYKIIIKHNKNVDFNQVLNKLKKDLASINQNTNVNLELTKIIH